MERLFSDMTIYIPTYMRVHRQKTWREMPPKLVPNTRLVCIAAEAPKHMKCGVPSQNIVVQPENVKTISTKRQWIMEQCPTEYAIMMDDDLRICCRHPTRGLGTNKDAFMVTSPPERRVDMMRDIRKRLEDYAHVGVSMRMGNQSKPPGWHENKRMVYVLAYHVPTMLKWTRFDAIEHREDMWVTLSLMRAGFPNSVSYEYASDQLYGTEGGEAAAGRSMDKSDADALKLADEFPGLVRVAQRQYKQSQPRLEVTVSWNKACSEHLT